MCYKKEVLWNSLLHLDEIKFFSELSFLYFTNMFNLGDIKNENNKEHNLKWLYIPDYPYRILINRGSGSG